MSYKTGFYEGRLGIGLGSTMGMGDGNPRYSLDINGDIRLTGSIVNGEGQVLSLTPPEYTPVEVGLDANNSLIYNTAADGSSTGGRNICVGWQTGKDLAPNNSEGSNNVFLGTQVSWVATTAYENVNIGYQAGVNLTTGNKNIALGTQAGYAMTSAYRNVCIGHSAGHSTTSGGDNVFIGAEAGYGKTNKTLLVAIGREAMQSNAGGQQGVAIGYQSMKGATNGNHYDNTAVGYQTMRVVSSGAGNCFFGRSSGYAITSGWHNACYGMDSGYRITGGYRNVCIGFQSGYNITTSNDGVFIGAKAGYNTTSQNIAVGYQSLYNQSGSYNVAIGYNALYGTTANTSRQNNIAIGYNTINQATSAQGNIVLGHQAGQAITTGNTNLIAGFQTGLNLTSGGNNIFLGTSSGYNGSSANNNIAIGDYVMYGATGGVNNIAIGNRCLYNGPDHSGGDTGKYNVAIGYYCAYSITTGYNNVFMGMNAGNSTTSGYNNVSIGAYATTNINTGYANTCIGYNAGRNMTTGYYNTCIGYATGYELTTGYQNVMIGMEAGYYSNTACVGNIFIGRFAGPKSSDGNHHNRLAIGAPNGTNSDTYRGYDGAFLWGDFNSTTLSSRYLRVNGYLGQECSPSYPLEVDGWKQTSAWNGYYVQATTASTSSGSGQMVSIKAKYMMWSTGYIVNSDQRIKTNISEVPDNLSLQKLRDISCCYYEYKDKLGRGSEKTIGFIAQQVKEHMPMAVSIRKNIIPNEMRNLENISWEEITDNSSNQYKLTTDLSDCSGVKYQFFVSNDPSGNDECKKEIIGNEDNTFTFDSSYNNVFCYGKEVDDFHTLDKQKLFALNFSATQELDKKVIALENENAELKAELAAIKQHLGI